METTPPLTLTDQIALLIDGLRKALGAAADRTRTHGPIWLLAWIRLQRIRNRWVAYVAKYRAGTLRPVAVRVRPPRPQRYGPPAPRPALRLSGKFGWMVTMAPETSPFRSGIEQLLADPETAAMLAIAPQLGRTLRPLCHMMRIKPPFALPRRPRPPRKKPAPPPPEPHPEMFRWPHASFRARFGTKRERDRDIRAWEAEHGKKWASAG